LVPGIDECRVADLYRCFIEDLLERVSSGHYKFFIAFDPPEKEKDFSALFGKDFSYLPQTGADLGERMYNAFISCFAGGFRSVVVIGSDSPDLSRGSSRRPSNRSGIMTPSSVRLMMAAIT